MRVLGRHSIGAIGLGYVGLPRALEIGKKKYRTGGFHNNPVRIKELKAGRDAAPKATSADLNATRNLRFPFQPKNLEPCAVYVATVPTPIDRYNRRDLTLPLAASETVGRVPKKRDIVIYQSTVYPGCTEEICVPALDRCSSPSFNQRFHCEMHQASSIKVAETAKVIENIRRDVNIALVNELSLNISSATIKPMGARRLI